MNKPRLRQGTQPSPRIVLPVLRVSVVEAAEMLRMSRALLYRRIREGSIRVHKDGTRTYIALTELKRYVASCARRS